MYLFSFRLDKVLVRHRGAADHVGKSDWRPYVCRFLWSSSTLPCGVPALNYLDIPFNACFMCWHPHDDHYHHIMLVTLFLHHHHDCSYTKMEPTIIHVTLSHRPWPREVDYIYIQVSSCLQCECGLNNCGHLDIFTIVTFWHHPQVQEFRSNLCFVKRTIFWKFHNKLYRMEQVYSG